MLRLLSCTSAIVSRFIVSTRIRSYHKQISPYRIYCMDLIHYLLNNQICFSMLPVLFFDWLDSSIFDARVLYFISTVAVGPDVILCIMGEAQTLLVS